MSSKVERIPNPAGGLRAFLIRGLGRDVPWLDPTLDEKRIFVGGVRKEFVESHQNVYHCINFNMVGYPGDMSEAPRSTKRVDFFSYGDDFEIATDIDLAVYGLLKPLRGTVVSFTNRNNEEQSIYIYAAIPGGEIYNRDPDTDWPCVLRSYRIRFGERNVY